MPNNVVDLMISFAEQMGIDIHDLRKQLATAIATTGDLTTLGADAKASVAAVLVAMNTQLKSLTTTAVDKTYVDGAVATAITGLKDNAPAVLDTIGKIAAELAKDEAATTSILQGLAGAVRFDQAQNLTAPQQAQALGNIGAASAADLGVVAGADFVSKYTAKRDAA